MSLLRHHDFLARAKLIGLCLFVGMCLGCGHWLPIVDRTQKPEPSLPKPRVSPDAVAVDIVFLRLPMVQEGDLEAAWQSVNEQAIDIKMRRSLDANGIRAGVIQGTLPIPVQRWIDENEKRLKTDVLEQVNVMADVASDTRRLVCRAGKRKEIIVRPVKPGTLVLMHNDGQGKGRSFEQASLVLEMKALPKPDGTAEIKLVPETQHGPSEPSFVGQDFAWRREYRRAAEVWEEATVQTTLSRGQILMITGTVEPRALGDAYFWTDTMENKRQRVVLLIRLANTQLDDLFDPEKTKEALRAAEGS
jgi:hypothetical protein